MQGFLRERSNWRLMAKVVLAVSLTLLFMAGCRAKARAATPVPTLEAGTTPAALPAVESAEVIDPQQGGTVALSDGARVTLPPQGLSAEATVTLKISPGSPGCFHPVFPIGPAYEPKWKGASDRRRFAEAAAARGSDARAVRYRALPLEWHRLGADQRAQHRRGHSVRHQPGRRLHPAGPVELGRRVLARSRPETSRPSKPRRLRWPASIATMRSRRCKATTWASG